MTKITPKMDTQYARVVCPLWYNLPNNLYYISQWSE